MTSFNYSGKIKNLNYFNSLYGDFVEWCKRQYPFGTFHLYQNGEPYFEFYGTQVSYKYFKAKKINYL